jgi:hypothetical protein
MTWNSIPRYMLFISLFCFFSAPTAGNEDSLPDVKVELISQKLSLHITVRSRSEDRVTLAQWRLPWGRQQHIMHFVPVDSDGACVANNAFPEVYPDYRKISIEPKGYVSGEIDLQTVMPNLSKALKKSDVHLFWVYRAPEELHIAQYSGGWVLIPQKK